MKYLIDTNILLWFSENNVELPQAFKDLLFDDSNEIYVSIVTLWEIAIKYSIGKLNIPCNLELFLDEIRWKYDFIILPLEASHILKQATLPFHHRDPFDRMLYAQSVIEKMKFLYTDIIFDKYRESKL